MLNKNGFTLIEILVTLFIVGLLAAISVPTYTNMVNQGASNAAQNNLISIYNAEKVYYLGTVGNGTYCTAACSSAANINATLLLNISDNNFGYACAADASGFKCTATNANSGVTLSLINTPIVLLGGTNCATTSGLSCNPSCAPAASSDCPSG